MSTDDRPPGTRTCRQCGEPNPETARFCHQCGKALDVEPAQAQDARKSVTILFSDLVDSTALGEALDAETLIAVMDRYFGTVRAIIESHGGVVEKFIGDAVMAVFGLPRAHEDDALRAVRAADEMRESLGHLNTEFQLAHGVQLANRTGVNSGVVIGRAGIDGQRLATGDTVNVAARLEQAAPRGGIVLGPTTWRLVRPWVETTSIGQLELKGKAEPMEAFLLDALRMDVDRPALQPMGSLVGRQRELDRIEELAKRAWADDVVETMLVLGDPGVGKTRLLQEAVARLSPTALVLTSGCRPYGTTAYWPLAQLLRGLRPGGGVLDLTALRSASGKASDADRATVVERVASLLGLSTAVFPLDECFWAAARLLQTLARERPLVIVLEDLHWAEDGLLDLLDHLRLAGQGSGILVLASSRPELLERRWSPGSAWHLESVRLHTLTAAESSGLIDGLLGDESLPDALRTQVSAAAEGNPLFLEQALTAWIEEGVLVRGSDGWTVARPITYVQVPDTVSAIYSARLDRLSHLDRLVIEAASVIGPTLVRDALPSMLDLEVDELNESLHRLASGGFLHPVGPTAGTMQRLAFSHASLRDVAYALTLKSDRARLHERFADWRDSLSEDSQRDEAIGHHLAEAYRYRTELRLRDVHTQELAIRSERGLCAACQRALALGDKAASERLVGHVVEVAGGLGPSVPEGDVAVLADVARVLVSTGRWGDAVKILSPFVEAAPRPALRDLGVSLCQLYGADPMSAQYREGQRLLEVAAAPPEPDPDALASLAGTWKGIDDQRAHSLYRDTLSLAPGDPYALGNVVEYEVTAAGDLSVVTELRDQLSRAALRCRAQADAGVNLPWAFFDAGKFALLLGDPYAALATYAKAAQLASAEHMLTTSMASVERLSATGQELAGARWVIDVLRLARSVRFGPTEDDPGAHALDGVHRASNVVVLAGGTDGSADEWLTEHGPRVRHAFNGIGAVLVSGGTRGGVAGLAGSIRSDATTRDARAFGYLPEGLPDDAKPDSRYDELRRIPGHGFTIAQPLQAWRDLVASGVPITRVRLLAINGGEIAGAEFRIALALGCRVGAVAGSGRETDRLLADPDWLAAPNLVRLDPHDGSIPRFLTGSL